MDFEGLLQSLINPGEDGPSETIYDDLRAAYNTVRDKADSAGAKISELTDSNSALSKTVEGLKSKNYDLLEAIGAGGDNAGDDESHGDDTSDADDGDDGSIASFFSKPKEA
nr:MAG TPA: hypothetical protein [Caudoviricetes sp.]